MISLSEPNTQKYPELAKIAAALSSQDMGFKGRVATQILNIYPEIVEIRYKEGEATRHWKSRLSLDQFHKFL